MRLNWLSPLPPVEAAGAEYTRHVLPALASLADVTLWTLQSEWDSRLEQQARVRRIAGDFWRELNQADMSLFNLGNNAEHYGQLWTISRQHPGVVILHSLGFPELFVKVYLHFQQDVDGFRHVMKRFYGDRGLGAVDRLFAGQLEIDDLADDFPLTEYGLERALGVVVHSGATFARLHDQSKRPVFRTTLPYSPRPHRREDFRVPRDGNVFRLIDFAYPEENRHTAPVLEALAQMPRTERFSLDVYGHPQRLAYLGERRDALGLAASVSFHGPVPGDQLEQALARADLAIHLRHPTQSEVPWSLLRAWEHALPSLVSRAGWHEELDGEAVWLVRPEREVEDVKDALVTLAEDPAVLVRMGQRGRAVLEEQHDPAPCARRLIEAASEARGSLGLAVASELAERAGAEIGQWSDARARAMASARVSEALSDLFGGR